MSSTIFVHNLIIVGTHGAHLPTAKPKEFKLDIEIDVGDISQAITTDDIAHVFDYRKVVSIARGVIEGPSVHLIETLSDRIIAKICLIPRVQHIKLTLTKRELEDDFDSGITVEHSVL